MIREKFIKGIRSEFSPTIQILEFWLYDQEIFSGAYKMFESK